MAYENILAIINDMTSNFLFLENGHIDIPTAGKFLNQLEQIVTASASAKMDPLPNIAGAVNTLLEKMIMEIVDRKEGFSAFEEGLTLMQKIGDSYQSTGSYTGDVNDFLSRVSTLTGISLSRPGSAAPSSEPLAADLKVTETSPAATDDAVRTKDQEKKKDFIVEDEGLLKDFIVEGLEYMCEIEVSVLNLEQNPEDKEYINAVFRPFHSVKGVAGFLNLKDISELAHALENLLDRARNNDLKVVSGLIDIILDGADVLKTMIGSLQEVLDGNRDIPFIPDLSDLKERIEHVDEIVEDVPEIKKIGEILIDNGVISEDNLKESLEQSQRAPHKKKLGETLITEGKATPRQVAQALRKQANQVADTSTIRVDVKKLDDLVDMIGELVICQSMIRQNPAVQESDDMKLIRDVAQLSTITSELQRTSTSLRMIPIKQTFQRMSRLVRDLAKNAGKAVAVILEGEETEIDRNMVEEIYNPLVHMVRNAVDHGIESTEERSKTGKPDQGTIQLKAYHKGGNIVIEIVDDGRGLKKHKIIEKAIERGLIESAEAVTEQELYRLIFHPGFSTAEKVTDVSGRGVGMDVVKQAVEKLRGKVDIQSREGQGTTFITYFPLTMAIVDGMIVRIGREKYIIPATAVRQLLRPPRESYNNVIGRGEMINVMGNLLPLVRLNKIFNIKADHDEPWDALTVVVEAGHKAKCFIVDEVIGKEEVVIKTLGDGLKNTKGISGGAILGNGNVGLIIDPEGVFELSER
ncbi:MAG: chemotaxis protein CheA [Deltaproteobacteria bacterium]|nr:chemotaxis protein CheA [Deltaproteobacteria bacterium]